MSHPPEPGQFFAVRSGNDASSLFITRADEVVWVSESLLVEAVQGEAPCITYVDRILTFHARNRTVVYEIGDAAPTTERARVGRLKTLAEHLVETS